MVFTYDCHKCGKENVVRASDIHDVGMGLGGAMADQLGWGSSIMGDSFFGGPSRGYPRREVPREIVHNCEHCSEKNIIKLR